MFGFYSEGDGKLYEGFESRSDMTYFKMVILAAAFKTDSKGQGEMRGD